MPHAVLIDSDFNASVVRAGWRRRRILSLRGAPPGEAGRAAAARIALLGHELGHFAHGDLARGLWVGTALDTIGRWHSVLSSVRAGDAMHRVISALVFVPLRSLITAYAGLIWRVNAPSHRRQEHFADLDAIRVGGSAGALALLDTLLAYNSVTTAITRAAAHPDRPDVLADRSRADGGDSGDRGRTPTAGRRARAQPDR